ncbi:chorismate synthase [Legionella birminghamensis]|uniref:Chorismate synthase n=1 Tax=Legionella birminghamensis TaxID=28083 RepID=A0A378IH35_9GAMM|nr:chorismate synthase [Legionella birminghamensis]STX31494.1 chorismate synthase [Legionella birminghamensis]
MSNTIGSLFRVTSFGENRGDGIGCIVDGCPPNLTLNNDLIQTYLDKQSKREEKFTSLCPEGDQVKILSGVFEGATTGTPIALSVVNDHPKKEIEGSREIFSPGQADYTYYRKYGNRDYRDGGRAAARDLIPRTAAGAIAQIFLEKTLGLQIYAYLKQIGTLKLHFAGEQFIRENIYFCPNNTQIDEITNYIDQLYAKGDSIGALLGIVVKNVPAGLGSPVFGRLDASLAHALMSITAVKGFEIGAGFGCVTQTGGEHRDQMNNNGFMSNNSGGVLGGISTGQDLHMSICLKPTTIIPLAAQTQTINGDTTIVERKGFYEPCIGMRAIPSAEAMVAITLMDQYLIHIAQSSHQSLN